MSLTDFFKRFSSSLANGHTEAWMHLVLTVIGVTVTIGNWFIRNKLVLGGAIAYLVLP